MKERIKVAITGAAGQIGYQLIFRLASGQVFGPHVLVDLNLLELEAALPSLEGVRMELDDCAFPTLGEVVCTSDVNVAMKGVNWALLVGAVPRKAGMERSDLLKINGGVFSVQGKALNEHAAKDVRILVVGNPCNTNCLILMHNAPNIPKDRFYAMTMLDQNRAVKQLAIKAGATVEDVKHLVIWGNHSSTQFPDFYHATIKGKPALEVIGDEAWLQNEFIPLIQQRGAAVIKARGASSAGSAANGIIDSVVHLIRDSKEGEWFSVCKMATDAEAKAYGVDAGLIFSFPCRREAGVVKTILDVQHNDFSKAQIQKTLEELRHERDAVKEMGLIE